MMITIVILNLSGQQELTLQFSGLFLLLFLPFAALMIGSGGFYSEFRDNAWIYLFSRPIKKEFIWMFKFVSQLSILLAIFLIFFFVRRFLPGLEKILVDLNVPDNSLGLFPFSLYVVMPLLTFTISFSISILHDKHFSIFFVTIIIGAGLAYLLQRYVELLRFNNFYVRNLGSFALFFGLSFVVASIITFVKSDFSQLGRKTFRFAKYAIVFLALSFFLATVWATNGKIFSPSKNFFPNFSQKYQRDLFIHSFDQGIIRYDSNLDKVVKFNKNSRYSFSEFSLREEKIVFLKDISKKRAWYYELWMMNVDGTEAKALVKSQNMDSTFHKKQIESYILAPDKKSVALVTTHKIQARDTIQQIQTLWWLDSSGSELKSHLLDIPHFRDLKLIAWPSLTDYLILLLEEKPIGQRSTFKIMKIGLNDGKQELLQDVLIDSFIWTLQISVSNSHEFLAFAYPNRENGKEILAILNLKTFEINEVFAADLLKLWAVKWSPDGSKLAFSRAKELWVYFLKENEAKKINQRHYGRETGFDWTQDGQKFVMIYPIYGDYHLRILGEEWKEKKLIQIPVPFREGAIFLWGLEDKVLLKGIGKGPLWRIDLDTEEWKEVF
jgi:WD40 repeat protein